MSDFEKAVHQMAEKAVLKLIAEGSWIAPDYQNRFKIPHSMLTDIWAMVDVEKVKARMAARVEEELADRIMNHLAAEMSTDIKQLLSNQERREALRAVARQHLDEIVTGGTK